MIKAIITLIFLVWPLGQFAILSPIFGLSWNILDLLLICLWLLLFFKIPLKNFKKDPLYQPLIILFFTFFISLLINLTRLDESQSLTALSYLCRFFNFFSFYFALKFFKTSNRLVTFSLAAFVVLGLLQYFFLPDTRFLKYFGFDDHYFRLIGTLFDPNFSGLVLAQITLISFSSLKKKYKIFSLIPLIAVILTFSRASYLSLLISFLYLNWKQKTKMFFLVLILIPILIFLAPKPFGEGVNLWRTFSITSRLVNQRQALAIFVQKPFLGWGFNALDRITNSYLYVLATTGIIGISAFIYFLSRLWIMSRHSRLFIAILISCLIHSCFNNSFFFLWETVFLMGSLALLSKRKVQPQ